jgi:UDP-N-acetylglucosamine pyrophosphorylase
MCLLIIFLPQFSFDLFKGGSVPRFSDEQYARLKDFLPTVGIIPMDLDLEQKSVKSCKVDKLLAYDITTIEMSVIQQSYVTAIQEFVKRKMEASANQLVIKKIMLGRILPEIKTWISNDKHGSIPTPSWINFILVINVGSK